MRHIAGLKFWIDALFSVCRITYLSRWLRKIHQASSTPARSSDIIYWKAVLLGNAQVCSRMRSYQSPNTTYEICRGNCILNFFVLLFTNLPSLDLVTISYLLLFV